MADDGEVFKNIFFSIVDGIILVSREGKILQVNLATEELFQQSRDSFLNKSVLDLFPDQADVGHKIQGSLDGGLSFHELPARGARKVGTNPFPVSLSISPFINEQGKPDGAVLHIRDRSLTEELEEISRPLDAISQMGALSLGMAHEIKNPLVSISGSAQLLQKKLPEEFHKYLDVVIKESDRINRMVDRMLNFARPMELDVVSINIHQLLEEILVLEKESREADIQFESIYDPSLPPVEGDADQLKQVFLNLIQNAMDAMPDGGTLKMITRYHTDYSVNRRATILVEIVDDGTGISEDNMKNLFTPFHTTKSQGNGLGLPLSLKIVENYQGKIKVISEEDHGTTVQVYLPVQQEKQ